MLDLYQSVGENREDDVKMPLGFFKKTGERARGDNGQFFHDSEFNGAKNKGGLEEEYTHLFAIVYCALKVIISGGDFEQ